MISIRDTAHNWFELCRERVEDLFDDFGSALMVGMERGRDEEEDEKVQLLDTPSGLRRVVRRLRNKRRVLYKTIVHDFAKIKILACVCVILYLLSSIGRVFLFLQ